MLKLLSECSQLEGPLRQTDHRVKDILGYKSASSSNSHQHSHHKNIHMGHYEDTKQVVEAEGVDNSDIISLSSVPVASSSNNNNNNLSSLYDNSIGSGSSNTEASLINSRRPHQHHRVIIPKDNLTTRSLDSVDKVS